MTARLRILAIVPSGFCYGLEAFARQGVEKLLQGVLEEEVEALLGRARYERREVIEDGEDGILVPRRDSRALAEAVKTLLADPGLRERMGARAREKARAYTWDRIARQTEALYERLLTSGPKGPALLAGVPCGHGGGRTHG